MTQRMKRKIRNTVEGYLFLSPVILGLAIFTALPILLSLFVSFTDYNNIVYTKLVGFENYRYIFEIDLFVKSIKNTFVFAGVSMPLSLFVSFFLAYMLNVKIKGIKVYRALVYLPAVVPVVASALVFGDMYNPTFGILNGILNFLGLPSSMFLANEKTAMLSMIIFSLWGCGGSLLIWLACFNSIPPVYYESASIDGARWYHRLFRITLPLATPIIFYNLIMGIISSLQVFGQMYIMTGQNNSTTTMVMMIYRYGLSYFEMGRASAMAWFMFAIIAVLTAIAFFTNKWVHYEN